MLALDGMSDRSHSSGVVVAVVGSMVKMGWGTSRASDQARLVLFLPRLRRLVAIVRAAH